MHDAARLYAALDATWPAAGLHEMGPWLIRKGERGGQRVSAAVVRDSANPADIAAAEIDAAKSEMLRLGQEPIFQIRPEWDAALDQRLAEMGYFIRDPVIFYQAPLTRLAQGLALPVLHIWPPLAMARDIWQTGGIGAERVAVMHRARGPKAAFLARKENRPAGAAFVAIDGDIAMLHAMELPGYARRKGAGKDMLRAAADWAASQHAETLALVVTRANLAARALYDSLQMTPTGGYHYRVAQPA